MEINTPADISSVNLGSQISVQVARKQLDAAKQEGDAAVELIRAAAEAGKQIASQGGRVDVVA